MRIVYYLNQFFGGIGGEEEAGRPPEIRPNALGPGRLLEQILGEHSKVVTTVICGDNYAAENVQEVVDAVFGAIQEAQGALLVAGPCFQAGRYGTAAGAVCAAVQDSLGIPAITAMASENPWERYWGCITAAVHGEAAKALVPDSRRVHNNTVVDTLEIAQAMLEGELEYRKGNFAVAFNHLRNAVELDDNLPYDEPWGWMQPARHALGALLLEQDQAEEAEAVYRADLGLDQSLSRACQHPNNLWSLHGLHECLTRRGETIEALLIKQALDQAMARSEVEVKASCYCRQNAA